MLALLIDVAPDGGGNQLLAIIALVIVVICVVTVVALATGLFVFIRLRQSRAAADAVRDAWEQPLPLRVQLPDQSQRDLRKDKAASKKILVDY